MAPVQQKIAAAFVLCSFLFLLHVDSANSLRCKRCHSTNANCRSGDVPDVECDPSKLYCGIWKSSNNELQDYFTSRDCIDKPLSGCQTYIEGYEECQSSCQTDNCVGEAN